MSFGDAVGSGLLRLGFPGFHKVASRFLVRMERLSPGTCLIVPGAMLPPIDDFDQKGLCPYFPSLSFCLR